MQYGNIPGVGKPISRIVQGTVRIDESNPAEEFEFLDQIFELGCNTFDTAHVYGAGRCERALGRWVQERGIRDQVVIITKGAHQRVDRKRVTPFDITSDLHDSLARLQVESIDLYLLHRDDPSVPVGPLIDVLNEHIHSGKIRAIGVSNWTPERHQEANDYANANGLAGFSVSSPQFSLAEQFEEPWPDCQTVSGEKGKKARSWYEQQNMPLFTWSSLAGGFFSGRFTRDNLNRFEEELDLLCVKSYCYEANFKRYDRVKELAWQKHVSIPQIALAYIFNMPLNIFALTGTQTAQEFQSNLQALSLPLTGKEMAWLDLKDLDETMK